MRRGPGSRFRRLRAEWAWNARPAIRQMVSSRLQSTEMPVAARNSSRNASFFTGEAINSEKTGAAMIKLPRSSAARMAAFAGIFKESSSFQRDTRTFVSSAVIIVRASGETNEGLLSARARYPVYQSREISQTGPAVRTGRTLQPVPFVSNSSLSPARTPRARRISYGTVICPLLVIRACFFKVIRHLPYFIIDLLTSEGKDFVKVTRVTVWIDSKSPPSLREVGAMTIQQRSKAGPPAACSTHDVVILSEESLRRFKTEQRDSSDQNRVLRMTGRLELFDLECICEDQVKEGPRIHRIFRGERTRRLHGDGLARRRGFDEVVAGVAGKSL